MHSSHRYYLFHKPFQTLCQFSESDTKTTLAHFLKDIPRDVYPIGRLDYDSEGLLLLTNDKQLTHRLLHPRFAHERAYWVQVEGRPDRAALHRLSEGGIAIRVSGKTHRSRPAVAHLIDPPAIGDRQPPIRYRKKIPTQWLSLTLTEGKNRQVRKMTAAIGFPTLRLIRYRIGGLTLNNLPAGCYIQLSPSAVKKAFQ